MIRWLRRLWQLIRGRVVWCALLCVASPALGAWPWASAWKTEQARRTTPTRTPTVAPATPTVTVAVPTAPVPGPTAPLVVAALPLATFTAPARVYLTDLLATAGGWAVLWLVDSGDLWEPAQPAELWYAHVGTPDVPARKLVDIHRIDRHPLYLAAPSPDGREIAVVVNELVNWKQLRRASPNRATHQWYGRLNLDGTWALPLQTKAPIETRLGVHGGVGHMTWTFDPYRPFGLVRVSTEGTCAKAAHQCTYSQRVDARTGAVVGRGQVTTTWHGHETAPQIIPFDAQTSWLTTISDAKTAGISAWANFLGGTPRDLLLEGFLLDYDPRSRWNGQTGIGRRIGTLLRQVRANDHKLNAAGEPWRMRFVTWDFVRKGSSTVATPLILSDVALMEWSTSPGYDYGYPRWSRWNTALEHLDGGGWAVGFQSDGQYVVGRLTEPGQWVWQQAVSPVIDYAGDVAVRGERIGYMTTRQTESGVTVELGER